MILIHDIRLPLSAGEPQAYEKALRLARIPRGKVSHLGIARLSVDATLCGPAGSLEALNPEQVVIEIDADDFYVAIGQQNIACRLYVPANDKIFALGSYVVQCKIESN